VQRPTATRLIARLTEQGLIAREDHPGDRRSHRVAVTAAGHVLILEIRARKTEYLAQAFDGLSADEQRTLDAAAAILERIMEEDR
jgi:DNA-binding MarR family transcriptional regulator